MKNYPLSIVLLTFIVIPSFFLFASCKNMNDTHQEWNNPSIYPAKALGAECIPGRHRVKIKWPAGTDKSLSRAVIYWNNREEWQEAFISPDQDTVEYVIGPLEERNYTFSINTFDRDNNRSVDVEVNGRPYGDLYAASLYPRELNSIISSGGMYVIGWAPVSDTTMRYTTVTYTDHTNAANPVQRSIRVANTAEQTLLAGVKIGENVTVTSAYLPGLDLVVSQPRQYQSDEETSPDQQLPGVAGERIPVVAQFGVRISSSSAARLKDMVDCGFTADWPLTQGAIYSDADFTKILDQAQQAGLKIVLPCYDGVSGQQYEGWANSGVLESVVTRYKSHPALDGYALWDEPSIARYDLLAGWVNRIRAVDPDHYSYILLFPIIQNEKLCGISDNGDVRISSADYRNLYIKPYLNKVSTDFIVYDHFGVYADAGGDRYMEPRFYDNFEIVSSEAKAKGIPFWAYASSCSAWGGIPVPTASDLRIQVYSALAYGAQGINYYGYCGGGVGAAVDPVTYEKSPTYYAVQEVNQEIKALSRVFVDSEVITLGHTGSLPQGTSALSPAALPSAIHSIETSGSGALVSVLKKGGNNYFLVIVSHDPNNEIQVKVNAAPSASLRRVKKDGSLVLADGRTYNVPAGDALIFFWKN
jgi:hypothetical protein